MNTNRFWEYFVAVFVILFMVGGSFFAIAYLWGLASNSYSSPLNDSWDKALATKMEKIEAKQDSLDAIFTVPQFQFIDTCFGGSFTFCRNELPK